MNYEGEFYRMRMTRQFPTRRGMKFRDLDRQRQEHIMANQHANLLAIEALARVTNRSIADLAQELGQQANEHVDRCNDVQVEAVMRGLDAQYE